MKKIILLVCAITALCSCGGSGNQNEKKVREVVEAKLKTEMNDWSSYEFVSAEAIDTIKYNRQIKKFPTEKQNVSLKHILT